MQETRSRSLPSKTVYLNRVLHEAAALKIQSVSDPIHCQQISTPNKKHLLNPKTQKLCVIKT